MFKAGAELLAPGKIRRYRADGSFVTAGHTLHKELKAALPPKTSIFEKNSLATQMLRVTGLQVRRRPSAR